MSDFRMDTAFFENKKTVKLTRRLGDHGVLSLIRLFRYTTLHKPTGVLDGMDGEDIEIAAGFTGEFGAFFAALQSIGWLDGSDPGPYSIHDWEEHNPWVAEAKDRADKARWNALIRHHGPDEAARRMPDYAKRMLGPAGSNASSSKSEVNSNTGGMLEAENTDADSNENECYAHADSNQADGSGAVSAHAPALLSADAKHATSNAPILSYPILSYPILSKDKEEPGIGTKPTPAVSGADSKSEARRLPLPKHRPQEFKAFYSAFPRAEDPADAAKAWDTVKPEDGDIAAINACLAPFGGKRLSKELAVRCKAPGPWLRVRRWEATDPFPGLTIEARSGVALVEFAPIGGGLMAKAAEIQSHIDSFATAGGVS